MDEPLFHVSEEGGIQRFEPRMPPSPDSGVIEPCVFAIGDRLLHNYLLPRECPRVTFYAGPKSTQEDMHRFMEKTSARHVVAVESRWLEKIRNCKLYCYGMPAETFRCIDETAAYYASKLVVAPTSVRQVDDLLDELSKRDVDLRVMPSLRSLRDEVAASTLRFSMIRMRNATD
jgi:hypothetical protein